MVRPFIDWRIHAWSNMRTSIYCVLYCLYVFVYCFIYVYFYLFVLSVLV
jgi:hypothetical protein